uniref:(northern house mosquito) hypothetical protein n=1 Tax=Culex pipiens TaxID=7175 RepID=A0A8D8AJS2_CULPI
MDEAMMCVQVLAELVDDWQRIFYVYSLGVNPDSAVPSWLQFASLQIPGTRPTAQRVGHKLRVTKQIWKAGQRKRAFHPGGDKYAVPAVEESSARSFLTSFSFTPSASLYSNTYPETLTPSSRACA